MKITKQWEVVSSVDNNVAFDAESVAREARRLGMNERCAANRIARENGDTEMGETLYVRAAECEKEG